MHFSSRKGPGRLPSAKVIFTVIPFLSVRPQQDSFVEQRYSGQCEILAFQHTDGSKAILFKVKHPGFAESNKGTQSCTAVPEACINLTG